MKRGRYGEIHFSMIPRQTATGISRLVDGAASAEHVDEHGAWEFGVEFDKKGRGWAVNWDIYGYGRDTHTSRLCAVVQIRKWEKTRHGYPSVRKSYFLLGRNEDESIFAHPVESRVIHHAIRMELPTRPDPAGVVRAAQTWIFGADYAKIIRHGDVALVPARAPKGDRVELPTIVRGSHVVQGSEAVQNGSLYVRDPALRHLPGVHPDVSAEGWHRIFLGRRVGTWNFAAGTVD